MSSSFSLSLLYPSLFPFTRPSLTERAHTKKEQGQLYKQHALPLMQDWFDLISPVPGGGGRKNFKTNSS